MGVYIELYTFTSAAAAIGSFNHHHPCRRGAHPPPPPAPVPAPMAAAGAAAVAAAALPCSLEDPSRKVRKPYTITKSRESWSDLEHGKFLEALHLFDRDWKKIEAFVGSKTVIQIRSHAQKYFLMVQQNGTSEHVPPPRPKRKAAHPYPQKAPKNAAIVTQAVTPLPASSLVLEPCYAVSNDSSTVVRNSTSNATLSSCVNGSVQPFGATQMTKMQDRAKLLWPIIVVAGLRALLTCCWLLKQLRRKIKFHFFGLCPTSLRYTAFLPVFLTQLQAGICRSLKR